MPRYKIERTQMYAGTIYEPDDQGFAVIPADLAETLEAARIARATSDEYHEELQIQADAQTIAEVDLTKKRRQ